MPHTHPKICWTASVYIVYENKVLLVDHKKLQSWLPVGGHIEPEEDTEEALTHEIREECGLDVTLLSPPLPNVPDATDMKFLPVPSYFDIHGIGGGRKHQNLVYFATSSNDQVTLAPNEHEATHWFTAEEIDDPIWKIWPSVKFYAKEVLRQAQDKTIKQATQAHKA